MNENVVRQLAPDLFTVAVPNNFGRSGQATNVYILGNEPATLIDAGSNDGGETVLRALDHLRIRSVDKILLTHTHHDHAGSADAVRRATGASVLVDERDLVGSGFEVVPDAVITAGDTFTSGPYTLTAIKTPGHAPGHISFHEPSLWGLFAGDLMSGFGTVAVTYPRGSMQDYLESLRRVQALDIVTVYPGHGPVIENGAERIEQYINHRERREAEILALIQDGMGNLEEITERLYPDVLPRFRGSARGTVLAHIFHLTQRSLVEVVTPATEFGESVFAPAEV